MEEVKPQPEKNEREALLAMFNAMGFFVAKSRPGKRFEAAKTEVLGFINHTMKQLEEKEDK
jgi:hypothetical protein